MPKNSSNALLKNIPVEDSASIEKKIEMTFLDSEIELAGFQCLNSNSLLSVLDLNGNYIFVNSVFSKIMGYQLEELKGQSHQKLTSGTQSTLFWKQLWEKILSGKTWRGEIQNRKKSGEIFWGDVTLSPLNLSHSSEKYFIEITNDITQKKIKELLLEVQGELQLSISEMKDKREIFNFLLNESKNITQSDWAFTIEFESSVSTNFNLDSVQMAYSKSSKSWDGDPSELNKFLTIFNPLVETRRPIFINKIQLSRNPITIKNLGVHTFSSLVAYPIQSNKSLMGVLAIADRLGGYKESVFSAWFPICNYVGNCTFLLEEKSKKNKLDIELRDHLILLEQTQDIAGIGGWIYNIELQELHWTRQLFRLFECNPSEYKPNLSSLSTFLETSVVDQVSEKLHNLVQRLEEFDLTVKLTAQFGEGRWVRIIGRPKLESGKVFKIVGTVQEVSQLKRQEKKIDDQRKKAMENSRTTALGQMAGGLAHEINNPLTIVLGLAKNFIFAVEKDELNKEMILTGAEKIAAATVRIAKVIKGLKAFAREGSKDPILESKVNSIIEDTYSFCEARVRNHGITMKAVNFSEKYSLRCRPVEISQALLNLVLNSDFAIRHTDRPWINIEFEQNLEWSIFKVTDSGQGISSNIADKIMEPFYTTKEPGMGMGLGLSVVASIVGTHAGQFYLDTDNPNTSFIIKIPRLL